jgi:hypothetical protein
MRGSVSAETFLGVINKLLVRLLRGVVTGWTGGGWFGIGGGGVN